MTTIPPEETVQRVLDAKKEAFYRDFLNITGWTDSRYSREISDALLMAAMEILG